MYGIATRNSVLLSSSVFLFMWINKQKWYSSITDAPQVCGAIFTPNRNKSQSFAIKCEPCYIAQIFFLQHYHELHTFDTHHRHHHRVGFFPQKFYEDNDESELWTDDILLCFWVSRISEHRTLLLEAQPPLKRYNVVLNIDLCFLIY